MDENIFNNGNSKTNGDMHFFNMIKDYIETIFDVGCRDQSEFIEFSGTVHYFDPVESFINKLKTTQTNRNSKSYFNNFGLSSKSESLDYYPRFESFYNRIDSVGIDDQLNKYILHVKRADEYLIENKFTKDNIGFVKIDTEGFGDYIRNIQFIQFEYGGTFIDNKIKLIDIINYLEKYGFYKFAYLTQKCPVPIVNFEDHYQYCNIVCMNKNSEFIPY